MLLKDNKKLMEEWNHERNEHLNPSNLTIGSNKKVWWKCSKGHEWQSTIYHRSQGRNCPYCANKKILIGYNDLKTLKPSLSKEWNYEKNGDLKPTDVTIGSNKKVWWKCDKGHEWQATIYQRNKNGDNCPFCSNRKIKQGENDLATVNPTLAKEWNYEKNGKLKPTDVSVGSDKKVWWKCDKGHEWQAVVYRRNKNGNDCPFCSNRKIKQGENDLATSNPVLAKEWNYEKNGDLKPIDVTAGSQISVWWICNKGHEWQAKIDKRNKGNNCPICGSERKTSVSEKSILFYIKKYCNGEIIPNYRSEIIKNKELDIYIKDLNIGIEYDGMFYHQNKKRDIEKDKICNKVGIKIYHIIENKEKNIVKHNKIYYDIRNQENLEWAIKCLLKILFGENKYNINLKQDQIDIYNLIEYYEKEDALFNKFPELVKEWNYEKNGKLKPEFVSYGSHKKVWWKCNKGHEWQAAISSRTSGHGCPYCSNNKVLKGFNDLVTINPTIAKEWNYEKNENLKPENFSPNSNKRVWWKCDKGHEWQAKIQNRNVGGKCPYCSNQKALKGYNDLTITDPIILKYWDYEKNIDIKPEDFLRGSNTRVWLKCPECKKEWNARIIDVLKKEQICSNCKKR